MKIRWKTALPIATLIAMMISARDRIWQELKPLPMLWKIILYVLAGSFITFVIIWSAGLEWIIFYLLGIQSPF